MKGKKLLFLSLCMLDGLLPLYLYSQVEKMPADELKQISGRFPSVVSAVAGSKMKSYADILSKKKFKSDAEKSIAFANAVRVAEDMKKAGLDGNAGFVHYAVRAMSDLQRLPDIYPVDGRIGGEARTVAARDEYEASSFVLFPFEDMTVGFDVPDLKSEDSAVLPKDKLDLKVVKVWLQNGNAWYSYFADTDLVPVPELLLKDENLIRSDFDTKANYARVKRNGKDVYQWISPERYIDSSYSEHGWLKYSAFRPMKEDFQDADTLQPVSLKSGEFKQMWLTVRVEKGTKEGLYRGKIGVIRDGKKVGEIPVGLRVLPFELPPPRTPDMKRDFLVCLYGGPSIDKFMSWNGGDFELAEKQMRAILKNFKAHNLNNPMLEGNSNDAEKIKRHFNYLKEAGLPTKPIIGGQMQFLAHSDPSGKLSPQLLKVAEEDAKRWEKIMMESLGHTNIYLMSGDEPPATWVALMRPAWKFYQERGIGVFTAGHDGIFTKGGYVYDVMPLAALPDDVGKMRVRNAVGHSYVGFYAVQHNGSENPTFVRRQHGLLGYLSGYSMIINYEFGYGPWNDLAYDLYKPMVLAYPTKNGLVDTIEWEAFREAVDDIRYMTLLKTEIERCRESKELETRYAARQVLMWIAQLDLRTQEIDSVRSEMIAYILKLRSLR